MIKAQSGDHMSTTHAFDKTFAFTVYAGYHQFYLQDEFATGSTAANDFWTPEASVHH